MSAPRSYSRSGGFKEGRAGFRPMEAGGQYGGRSGETVKHETSYRSRRLEQTPVRDRSLQTIPSLICQVNHSCLNPPKTWKFKNCSTVPLSH